MAINFMTLTAKPFRLMSLLLLGGVVTTGTTIGTNWVLPAQPALATLQDSPKTIVDEAWQLVNRHFVDGEFNQVDWLATRRQLLNRRYTKKEQAYTAIREALEPLNDPYTRFLDPEEYASLTTQTSGELSGVGIRLEINKTTRVLTIVSPLPGSPAREAGLKKGDQILEIDGQSTRKMDLATASALIKGKVGTSVKFKIKRRFKRSFAVEIERKIIELATVHHQIKQEGSNRLGYIHLQEFSAHATEQFKAALGELTTAGVDGFVLDLRGNPGGLLSASLEIADLWLERGLIVRTINREGSKDKVIAKKHTTLTNLPLVVLVDQNSASSSEILTGALQDNGRAQVIGSSTFGKALVQSVHQLSDGSGLAITIAQYLTPKGTDISETGIMPDIKLDLSETQSRLLTSSPKLRATFADPHYTQAVRSLQQLIFVHKTSQL